VVYRTIGESSYRGLPLVSDAGVVEVDAVASASCGAMKYSDRTQAPPDADRR
jgi:hypothetical protein